MLMHFNWCCVLFYQSECVSQYQVDRAGRHVQTHYHSGAPCTHKGESYLKTIGYIIAKKITHFEWLVPKCVVTTSSVAMPLSAA